jgi:putative two-component system response regulator
MMSGNRGTILVADDEPRNIALVTRLMSRLGYDVLTATNGTRALEAVRVRGPDVVLLDVNMPEVNGIDVCRAIKENPRTWLTPVILLTALSATEDRIRGLQAGADDFLSKPFVSGELAARVAALIRTKSHTDLLESAESTILSLGRTIEARDSGTHGHCERLAAYACAFGKHLGLDARQCEALYKGGFLHDVGKVGIPDAILLKAGPLTTAEHKMMQRHTTIGDALCGEFRSLGDVRAIVRHHHERLDGTGYPDKLAGDHIPKLAQIISIVDGFDAMTTDRPYRAALSHDHAFSELRLEARKGWKDALLVDNFISMIGAREEE